MQTFFLVAKRTLCRTAAVLHHGAITVRAQQIATVVFKWCCYPLSVRKVPYHIMKNTHLQIYGLYKQKTLFNIMRGCGCNRLLSQSSA